MDIEEVQTLSDIPIPADELHRALNNFKRRSAPGVDVLTYQMIRNLYEETSEQLLANYHRIWETGVLPHEWLVAILGVYLKMGDR